jgi:hypothetical protein
MNITNQSPAFKGQLTKEIYKNGKKTVEHYTLTKDQDAISKAIADSISDNGVLFQGVEAKKASPLTTFFSMVTGKPIEKTEQKTKFITNDYNQSLEYLDVKANPTTKAAENGVYIKLNYDA